MATHSSTLTWKNPMDGGARWAAISGVTESQARMSDFIFIFPLMQWKRKHSLVFLPGESQGIGEPGGLPSMGSNRIGHDWHDLAAAANWIEMSVIFNTIYSIHLFCQCIALRKILKEMGIPDHLNCLFRNLFAGQDATARAEHATTDWFQIGKEVCQGCILSPCLFNLYAEYIMGNAGLEEA